ncbi:hypothetical protein [Piscibacillus halophilus]|uniref:YoqO-like protein n=1 Tax=Piscibacillus halophilus TaxID=571933 RepID=A0A1H9IVI6_9BACI|nr:hypothetical protein [Piscibacillus halophilus]SEQ78518.1 hypothetical protein SAMN05216362_12714 [Piscibacillus halophilus]
MELKLVDYIILMSVVVLLIVDHFIDGVPHNVVAWVFAGIIVYSLNYKKYKEESLEVIRNWQIISTVIISAMVLIFTIVGTVDEPGVSLTSGIFWFALLLSIFEIVYQSRQIKKGTDDR